MQALSLYQSSTASTAEPPPPYPIIPPSPSGGGGAPPPPPSYSASIQNRQSPTQDFRKSPSSGIYSGSASTGSPSPIPVTTSNTTVAAAAAMARPTPLQAWGARQAKTQPPIIMQSVKSTQVQKPVLQTAVAPTAPQITASSPTSTTPPAAPTTTPQPPPPSYTASIQQKAYTSAKPAAPLPNNVNSNNSTTAAAPTVPITEPPSYATTMQAKAKAVQRGITQQHPLPPPPYTEDLETVAAARASPHQPLQRKYSPVVVSSESVSRSDSPQSTSSCDGRPSPGYPDNGAPPLPPTGKLKFSSWLCGYFF